MTVTAPYSVPDNYGIVPKRRYVSGQITMTATGDKVVFTPAGPCFITRWGVIANALIDVGAGMVAKLDYRPTAGSDSSRVTGATSSGVDTAGGTLSTSTTDISQGHVLYRDLSQPLYLVPGEEAVIQISDAADTAGTGYFFIEYADAPFQGDATLTTRATNALYHATKATS